MQRRELTWRQVVVGSLALWTLLLAVPGQWPGTAAYGAWPSQEEKARALNFIGPVSGEHRLPTLHVMKPLAGQRPVKALFLPRYQDERDVVEVVGRFDLAYDRVSLTNCAEFEFLTGTWGLARGVTDPPTKPSDTWPAVAEDIIQKLKANRYDVVVLSASSNNNKGWTGLRPDARDRLREAVEAGAGMVFVEVHHTEEAAAFVKDWGLIADAAALKSVSDAFGLKMPAQTAIVGVPEAQGVLAGVAPPAVNSYKLAFFGRLGKGRVAVLCAYGRSGGHHFPSFGSLVQGEAEAGLDPHRPSDLAREQYQWLQLGRAVLWAAGVEPMDTPTLGLPGREVALNDLPTAAFTVSASPDKTAAIDLVARNHNGEVVWTGRAKPAATPVSFRLPRLPAGAYFLEAVARDQAQAVTGWRMDDFAVTSPVKVSVSVSPASVEPGQDIALSGRVEGLDAAGGPYTARWEVKDSEGRLVLRAAGPLPAQAAAEAKCVFATKDVLAKLHFASLIVSDGRGEVARNGAEAVVRRSWDMPFRFAALWREMRQSEDYFHTRNFSDRPRTSARRNLDNMAWAGGAIKGFDLQNLDPKQRVRKPCLSDPEVLAEARGLIEKKSKEIGSPVYGNVGSIYADEWNYSDRPSHETDACVSPSCLKVLRDQCQAEYATLEALNATWQTDFKAWDEVTPPTLAQVKEDAKWDAAWCDHRRAMETVVKGFFDTVNDEARKWCPGDRWGLSGTRNPGSFNGMDWWKVMQSNPFISTYGGPQVHLSRSFKQPDAILSQWVGYDRSGTRFMRRAGLWECLFMGRNYLASFSTNYSPYFWGDYSPRMPAVWTRECLDDMLRGMAHIVLGARRQTYGLAIHYSQSSVHASNLDKYRGKGGGEKTFNDNLQSWTTLLQDLRLDADFLAYAQVEQGKLNSGEYRLLILPYSVAMSPKEVAEVRRFVENGGTVIADVMPAVRDQHCRLLDASPLADVFGASFSWRRCGLAAGVLNLDDADLRAGGTEGGVKAVAGSMDAAAKTGRALGRIEAGGRQASAVVVNAFGKGQAVLLNFSFHDYTAYLAGGVGGELSETQQAGVRQMEAVRQVVGALMARRGVTPDVRLTEDAPGALARPAVFQFLIGDARYVGLVPKIALAESKTPTDAFAVALDIGRPAFVYDARKGRFLGQGQTFQIEVSYSDGSFLAALPRPVEGLAVACEPARQGDTARVRVKRLSAGEDLAFAQLCVFRPDKTEAFVLRRVVRVEGNAATTDLPIALNDPPGDWRLEVRDAATGATATGVLSVRPQ